MLKKWPVEKISVYIGDFQDHLCAEFTVNCEKANKQSPGEHVLTWTTVWKTKTRLKNTYLLVGKLFYWGTPSRAQDHGKIWL